MEIPSRAIAIANLVLGVLYLSISLIIPIFILPSVTQTYSALNINKPSFTFTYIILGVVMLMGMINLFFGFKILNKKNDKYLKYGIIFAVVTFFLGSFLTAIASLSVTSSIYNMTSQF